MRASGPGVGHKNAGEDVLVGLGEPEEGEALSAVVVGWGCEKIGVPSMPNLKVVVSGVFIGTGVVGSTLKLGGIDRSETWRMRAVVLSLEGLE